MDESTTAATVDDNNLVAKTSALTLEESEMEPKPRAPFGSRWVIDDLPLQAFFIIPSFFFSRIGF